MNDDQRRCVTTTLLRLNRTLSELGRLIGAADANEPMFYSRNRLEPVRRTAISQRLAQARAAIAAIMQKQGIKPEEHDPMRSVWAELNTHWVSLEEAKSAKLTVFGPVEPVLKETLDPAIDELIGLVRGLTKDVANPAA